MGTLTTNWLYTFNFFRYPVLSISEPGSSKAITDHRFELARLMLSSSKSKFSIIFTAVLLIFHDPIQAFRFRYKKIYHAFIQNVKHFVSIIPMQNVKATSTNLFSPNELGLGLYIQCVAVSAKSPPAICCVYIKHHRFQLAGSKDISMFCSMQLTNNWLISYVCQGQVIIQ